MAIWLVILKSLIRGSILPQVASQKCHSNVIVASFYATKDCQYLYVSFYCKRQFGRQSFKHTTTKGTRPRCVNSTRRCLRYPFLPITHLYEDYGKRWTIIKYTGVNVLKMQFPIVKKLRWTRFFTISHAWIPTMNMFECKFLGRNPSIEWSVMRTTLWNLCMYTHIRGLELNVSVM